MKKLLSCLLVALLAMVMVGCTKEAEEPTTTDEPTVVEEPTVDYAAKSEGVMTYAEYDAVAADNTTKVTIEGYVQAVQSYWNGATMYLADPDGAYFVYTGNITEEDYAKLGVETTYGEGWTGLANGTKVQVVGYKTAWAGEVEIGDVESVTIVDDVKWIAEAEDATASLADLTAYMNKKIALTGLTVTKTAIYNWDGSGTAGSNSDLYYEVSDGTTTLTFVVESYLCYEGSEVYNAVLDLKEGDVVDLEGFCYWYEGAQLHTTKVTVK